MKGKEMGPDLEKALTMDRPFTMEDASVLLSVSSEEAAHDFRNVLFRLRRRQAWAGLVAALEQHPDVSFVAFDFEKPSLASAVQPSFRSDGMEAPEEVRERFSAALSEVWEAVGASDAAKTAVAQGFRGMGRGYGEWFPYALSRADVVSIARKVLENPYVTLEDPVLLASIQQESLDNILEKTPLGQRKPRM